ncbi:MAG: L-lactate permease [Candidatus Woesearchaeota archaeon]
MLLTLIAFLPIFLLLVLMAVLRWPASRAMPVAWVFTVLVGIFAWSVPSSVLAASSLKGAFVAVEILLIVFGAVLLLRLLEKGGAIGVIDRLLTSVSPDRRVQAVFVAWMFGSFIEGAAGFGTPVAFAAPLLVSIGFPAIAAVIVALVANSTAVTFGAVGTPILLGIGSILPEGMQYLLSDVSLASALLHAIIGTFVPLAMACILTRFFGANKSWMEGLSVWPYAIWAGLCFTVPYYLSARFLGPEFPSLVGGIAGMLLLGMTTKVGLFVPKTAWGFPRTWPKEWETPRSARRVHSPIPLWKALLPYCLVAVLLIITRLRELPVGTMLKKASIVIPFAKYAISPFYSPGFVFILVCIVVWFLYGMTRRDVMVAVDDAFVRLWKPLVALVFAIATVQIIMNSGSNTAGLPSMPWVIGNAFASFGSVFLLLSPLLGVIGSFIAGSNTVSNLLFGPFQLETAITLGFAPFVVLALQSVGGAVGNMIAVHNIIAASATAGLYGEEGRIIKMNIVPAVVYALLAGMLAIVLF